jgi:hypothetical protein
MVTARMNLLACLLGASGLVQRSWALPTDQAPLLVEDVVRGGHSAAVQSTKQRPLHGRFLHMTGACRKTRQHIVATRPC